VGVAIAHDLDPDHQADAAHVADRRLPILQAAQLVQEPRPS